MDVQERIYDLEREVIEQYRKGLTERDTFAVELLAIHQLSDLGDDYVMAVSLDDIKAIGEEYENCKYPPCTDIALAVNKVQEQIEEKFESIADEYFMQFDPDNDYDYR